MPQTHPSQVSVAQVHTTWFTAIRPSCEDRDGSLKVNRQLGSPSVLAVGGVALVRQLQARRATVCGVTNISGQDIHDGRVILR